MICKFLVSVTKRVMMQLKKKREQEMMLSLFWNMLTLSAKGTSIWKYPTLCQEGKYMSQNA